MELNPVNNLNKGSCTFFLFPFSWKLKLFFILAINLIFKLLLGADLAWSMGDVVGDAPAPLFMEFPDEGGSSAAASSGGLDLDLHLGVGANIPQPAPAVVENQEIPVFNEKGGELYNVIDRMTSEEVKEVLGRYPAEWVLSYPGAGDLFSAEQKVALNLRALHHLSLKDQIISLMATLDPENPWVTSREIRERYLLSFFKGEFTLLELSKILQDFHKYEARGYWYREIKRRRTDRNW